MNKEPTPEELLRKLMSLFWPSPDGIRYSYSADFTLGEVLDPQTQRDLEPYIEPLATEPWNK